MNKVCVNFTKNIEQKILEMFNNLMIAILTNFDNFVQLFIKIS